MLSCSVYGIYCGPTIWSALALVWKWKKVSDVDPDPRLLRVWSESQTYAHTSSVGLLVGSRVY